MSPVKKEVRTITPEIATLLLQRNTMNRPLKPRRIDQYARVMASGGWVLTYEPIIYNNQFLLDGQNRLHAVVKSDTPIQALVVEGAPTEIFSALGQGDPRNTPDIYALMGEKNTKLLASTIRLIDRYLTKSVKGKRLSPANPEMIELLEQHPAARISVAKCNSHKRICSLSVLSASHYFFSKLDTEAADLFIDQLTRGFGLEPGDPVYLLRERLLNERGAKAKLNTANVFALTIKAWNARRAGQRISYLRWREGGIMPEAFPVIR